MLKACRSFLHRQSLSMLLGLVMLTLAPQAISAPLSVETNFGEADKPIKHDPARVKGRIEGVHPAGWLEDSLWADVDVSYVLGESEGRRYLRLDIDRIGSGKVQMRHPLPTIAKPTTYELSVTMRNQSREAVHFTLRQRGAPYTAFWNSPPLSDGEWATHTFRFKLDAVDIPIGLYLAANGVGHVDIAKVKLRSLDPASYRQAIAAQYPNGGPANLIRHTRFASGLPTGWTLDSNASEGDQVNVTTNDAGQMTITTDRPTRLAATPFFVVNPLVPHSAVARVSGTGAWEMQILPGVVPVPRPIAKVNLSLEPGTPRDMSLSFKPDLFIKRYQVIFRAHSPGTLKLDWIKAGPSSNVGSVDASASPAIDLRMTDADAALAQLQFTDEDAAIEIRTVDAPENTVIRLALTHGIENQTETLTFPAQPMTRVAVLNETNRPLGAHHLETWLEADGQRITPVAERTVYRLRRPRYWGEDAPQSAFGVHVASSTRLTTMAKALGLNWVRMHGGSSEAVCWHFLEPEPGKWVFDDAVIHRYRAQNMVIFGQFGTTPYWASFYDPVKRNHQRQYHDKYFRPRDLADFQNYVRVLAERYKEEIRYWDVWNEPWIHAWWAVDYDPTKTGRDGYLTSEHAQADFVEMMAAAQEAAKSVDPDLKLSGFNTTHGDFTSATRTAGPVWTKGVYDAGGMDHADILVYHQYESGTLGHPGDAIERGLESAFGYVHEQEGDFEQPIWMTEGQPNNSQSAYGMYRHTIENPAPDSFLETSDRLIRFITSMRANNVEKFFLYAMDSYDGTTMGYLQRWRVLTQSDGTTHPSAAALSAVAYHIDGLDFLQRVEPAKGVYVYIFGNDERRSAVVTTVPHHAAWPLPAGSEDLWGNPIQPGTPMGGYSVFLTDADTIDRLRN